MKWIVENVHSTVTFTWYWICVCYFQKIGLLISAHREETNLIVAFFFKETIKSIVRVIITIIFLVYKSLNAFDIVTELYI